ncbi:hypothetical protein LTR10_000206 [Elasticomyces elasticus]|nr:hypothetical protein LTR10_000206 [Elasticomyces elasticus]KAK4980535.1 hypothetical protein LTR42_000843 [Elasticomyces elasticus]
MSGDFIQPHERSSIRNRAPPAIMTSINVQPGSVQSTSLLKKVRPLRPKLKLSAGQPPCSEDERLPKRANDSTDSDSIDTRGSKRSKINDGSALEAPLRRRTTSSKRDSEANTTNVTTPHHTIDKPASKRLRIEPLSMPAQSSWKKDYESLLPQLEKERDAANANATAHPTTAVQPLCASYSVCVANLDDSNMQSITGYLNLYNTIQVGVLWTAGHKAHGCPYEKTNLRNFLKYLDAREFWVEAITRKDAPAIARPADGSSSERWWYLFLARFVHQVFCAVKEHREKDLDFPDVFSGAGGASSARMMYAGSLDWVTEDIARAVTLWSLFATKAKTAKNLDFRTRGTKKPPVLPFFLVGQERISSTSPLVAANLYGDLVLKPVNRNTTDSSLVRLASSGTIQSHVPTVKTSLVVTKTPSAVVTPDPVSARSGQSIPLAVSRPDITQPLLASAGRQQVTQLEDVPETRIPPSTVNASHTFPNELGEARNDTPVDHGASPAEQRLSLADRKTELKRKLDEIKERKEALKRANVEKKDMYDRELKMKEAVEEKMVEMMQEKFTKDSDEVERMNEAMKINDELIRKVREDREGMEEAIRSGDL